MTQLILRYILLICFANSFFLHLLNSKTYRGGEMSSISIDGIIFSISKKNNEKMKSVFFRLFYMQPKRNRQFFSYNSFNIYILFKDYGDLLSIICKIPSSHFCFLNFLLIRQTETLVACGEA